MAARAKESKNDKLEADALRLAKDAAKDITEIRRMVGQGRSYREIMDTLGIAERTFYRYLSQAYEHDKQLLMEQERDII
jgi:hypothetical protein